jgi:hypothetical protein
MAMPFVFRAVPEGTCLLRRPQGGFFFLKKRGAAISALGGLLERL